MKDKNPLDELSKEELINEVMALRARESARKKTRDKIASLAGKGILRIVAGGRLYNSTLQAWNAWLRWLRSNRKNYWPEMETGIMLSALIARFFRIGAIALIVATIPAVTLIIQTPDIIPANSTTW